MVKSAIFYVALTASLVLPVTAHSAIVHLGSGNTVDFYYDNADPGTLAYGTLQISGDTVYATPTTFETSALNGEGTSLFTNTGSVIVIAKDGYSFAGVDILEGGTYNTTVNGYVNVESSLQVIDSDNFFTRETNFLNISDLTASGLNTWEGYLSYDMTTAMWNNTNSIELTLTNWLYATSPDADSTAVINKTLAGSSIGMSITTVVPVPAAIWLFGSGLIALSGFARRRK
ncbi:MAG: VPLPA-CTERM sorting domain-containing protein [Gammaproteobacteria bacterium]|nr:VPLPA-CTERM sorting domain-containing protein [Gammaproteobacteria bacterium]